MNRRKERRDGREGKRGKGEREGGINRERDAGRQGGCEGKKKRE